jgi:hypothetical protein
MNDVTKFVGLPEEGSRVNLNGFGEAVVRRVAKRGRGYQVFVEVLETGEQARLRLKDFLKDT